MAADLFFRATELDSATYPEWRDGIVSAEYLERYAALIPKARTDTIGEAGHLPQVEHPGTTAAKVLHFLDDGKAAETSGARA